MIYTLLISLIKKQIYIVFQETYKNPSNSNYIDRFVGKHPLLKPELLIVDDQPYGFKHMSKHVVGLENFPMYVEIEYELDDDDEKLINSVEIYSEVNLKSSERMDDVLHLTDVYRKTITVDRVQRLNDRKMEFLFIYSKLSELFEDGELEQDIMDGLVNEKELKVMFDIHLTSFLNFIKLTDDVLTKGISVKTQTDIASKPTDGTL